MNAAQLTEALLRRYNVRVLPATVDYLLKRRSDAAGANTAGKLPVMGVRARTGVPVRLLIDLHQLNASPGGATITATQQT